VGDEASRRRAADAAPPEGEDVFRSFWDQYPKRQGEDAAHRAFSEAVAAGADPQAVIAGALRYAADRADKPDRYTAMPANWLRDGRWKDEPAKPDHGGNSGGYSGKKPTPTEVCAEVYYKTRRRDA
jgi:hypothetical protein